MGNEVQPKVMLTRGCGYTTSLTNASSISHSAVPHGVTTSSRPLTISSTSDPPFGLPEDRRGKWDEMVRRLGLTTWKVDRQTEGNRQRMRRDKTQPTGTNQGRVGPLSTPSLTLSPRPAGRSEPQASATRREMEGQRTDMSVAYGGSLSNGTWNEGKQERDPPCDEERRRTWVTSLHWFSWLTHVLRITLVTYPLRYRPRLITLGSAAPRGMCDEKIISEWGEVVCSLCSPLPAPDSRFNL